MSLNKQFDKEDLKITMDFVIELRKKIANLLHRMALEEFERIKIEYSIKS